jgi:hypothetical protein
LKTALLFNIGRQLERLPAALPFLYGGREGAHTADIAAVDPQRPDRRRDRDTETVYRGRPLLLSGDRFGPAAREFANYTRIQRNPRSGPQMPEYFPNEDN